MIGRGKKGKKEREKKKEKKKKNNTTQKHDPFVFSSFKVNLFAQRHAGYPIARVLGEVVEQYVYLHSRNEDVIIDVGSEK